MCTHELTACSILDAVLMVACKLRSNESLVSKVVGSGKLLSVTRSPRSPPRKVHLGSDSPASEVAADEEVLALRLSRGRAVERYLLPLLWAVLRRLELRFSSDSNAVVRSQVAEMVAHHGMRLPQWLGRMAGSCAALSVGSDISHGLPISGSGPHFTFLQPLDGVAQKVNLIASMSVVIINSLCAPGHCERRGLLCAAPVGRRWVRGAR